MAQVVASAGIVAWKAVSKVAIWGTPGNRPSASLRRRSAGALCSGASDSSSSISQKGSVDPRRRREALAAVDHPVAHGEELPGRVVEQADGADPIVPIDHRSFTPVEPALMTSTRSRARASQTPRDLTVKARAIRAAFYAPGPRAFADGESPLPAHDEGALESCDRRRSDEP